MEELPGPMPYLSADPARLAKWGRRLAGLAGPLVVLVWAGRPSHVNDANRSTTLASFAPLAAVEGCSFLSVQKGPGAAEAAPPSEA